MEKNWWKKSTIYQIYLKSFQDTNNNGIGDIPGIIKRLNYIKLLNVDAIWLTPFYVSPQVDNGYDVENYIEVDPVYGTMQDFDNLIKEAHKLNLKIIIDMVFNHSSTKHLWFNKSLNSKNPYKEYYIWKNGLKKGTFPNNWKSKFGGPAWSWNKKRKQYYMHLWSSKQADLNWDNKKVRNEIKKIINFWADRGIDGIRLDVINLISKTKGLPNDSFGKDGLRLYTDGPNIHKYLQEMNKDVFKPRKLMTVGEMSSATLENCKKYSSLKGKELSMVFSFDHVEVDFDEGKKWTLKKLDLIKLKSIFSYWQKGMYKKAWNALFWCNHDQPRIVSRWGDEKIYRIESAKLLAMILHGMQGTPYIYQGEEIGMTNPHFSKIIDYKDIETHNMYNQFLSQGWKKELLLKILNKKSRDNGRTPMQWNSDKNGGFTKGKPWIKVNKNTKNINVISAISNKNSIFYTYKKLIQLRKEYNILTLGNYKDLLKKHPLLWCYKRKFKKEELIVIGNFSNKEQKWNTKIINNEIWEILVKNYPSIEIKTNYINLRPYESVWFYKKK